MSDITFKYEEALDLLHGDAVLAAVKRVAIGDPFKYGSYSETTCRAIDTLLGIRRCKEDE